MTQTRISIAVIILVTTFTLSHAALFLPDGQPAKAQVSRQRSTPRNLAILIFEGVQIIDYTGPYETFGHAYRDDGPAFNIYTVSEKTNSITTAMGMSVNPKYSFENAPKPDVLLIPGGNVKGQLENAVVIKWIQDRANRLLQDGLRDVRRLPGVRADGRAGGRQLSVGVWRLLGQA